MRNMFPKLRLFVATTTAMVALTTLANAGVFYVSQGASGKVGKVTDAGVPSEFASLTDAQGITTDASGNVFVASGTSINQITPGGSSSVYANYADTIGGLVIGGSGTLYGVSQTSPGYNVGTFDSIGNFTALTLTNPDPNSFYSATSVKMDGSGNLWVTNSGYGGPLAHSVVKLTTADSGATWTTSAFVTYAAETFKPFDVTSDPDGNVYVSSANSSNPPTINKYDSAGNLDGTFTLSGITTGVPSFMTGMTYVNDKLYAVGFGSYRMWEIDPTTGVATDFLTSGLLPDYRSTFLTYTAVPEPSVMALVALGGLALVGRRVSRKTNS